MELVTSLFNDPQYMSGLTPMVTRNYLLASGL